MGQVGAQAGQRAGQQAGDVHLGEADVVGDLGLGHLPDEAHEQDPSLTVEQVMAHARENLTGYKRPHYVEFRKELPKTNVGKILRRELRQTAAA